MIFWLQILNRQHQTKFFRDILVANPQSATSDKVLDELNNRFVPMPDLMMAEILAGEEIVSAKEALDAELFSHKARRSVALNNLIRFYKNDTTNPASHDSLIVLLQNESSLSSKYRLAFEYMHVSDTNNLNYTLSAITSTYNLSQQQSSMHDNYTTYFSVLKNLLKNGKNIFTMDSSLLPAIHNLHTNSLEPVKSYTRNILIARGAINYYEPILLPDELKSSKGKKTYRTGKFVEESYMKVFPNPAWQYVIIEYNLKDKFTEKNEVLLTLTNMRGNSVFQKQLMKRQDQDLINTSGFIPGVYICSLWVNGKMLDTSKFVVLE